MSYMSNIQKSQSESLKQVCGLRWSLLFCQSFLFSTVSKGVVVNAIWFQAFI